MKIINFFKLKKLFQKESNQIVKRLQNSFLFKISNYDAWKTEVPYIQELYEIRYQRYIEEDTKVIHNGFKDLIKELHLCKDKHIKIHSFDSNKKSNTSYTVFTNKNVTKMIGILEHIKKM